MLTRLCFFLLFIFIPAILCTSQFPFNQVNPIRSSSSSSSSLPFAFRYPFSYFDSSSHPQQQKANSRSTIYFPAPFSPSIVYSYNIDDIPVGHAFDDDLHIPTSNSSLSWDKHSDTLLYHASFTQRHILSLKYEIGHCYHAVKNEGVDPITAAAWSNQIIYYRCALVLQHLPKYMKLHLQIINPNNPQAHPPVRYTMERTGDQFYFQYFNPIGAPNIDTRAASIPIDLDAYSGNTQAAAMMNTTTTLQLLLEIELQSNRAWGTSFDLMFQYGTFYTAGPALQTVNSYRTMINMAAPIGQSYQTFRGKTIRLRIISPPFFAPGLGFHRFMHTGTYLKRHIVSWSAPHTATACAAAINRTTQYHPDGFGPVIGIHKWNLTLPKPGPLAEFQFTGPNNYWELSTEDLDETQYTTIAIGKPLTSLDALSDNNVRAKQMHVDVQTWPKNHDLYLHIPHYSEYLLCFDQDLEVIPIINHTITLKPYFDQLSEDSASVIFRCASKSFASLQFSGIFHIYLSTILPDSTTLHIDLIRLTVVPFLLTSTNSLLQHLYILPPPHSSFDFPTNLTTVSPFHNPKHTPILRHSFASLLSNDVAIHYSNLLEYHQSKKQKYAERTDRKKKKFINLQNRLEIGVTPAPFLPPFYSKYTNVDPTTLSRTPLHALYSQFSTSTISTSLYHHTALLTPHPTCQRELLRPLQKEIIQNGKIYYHFTLSSPCKYNETYTTHPPIYNPYDDFANLEVTPPFITPTLIIPTGTTSQTVQTSVAYPFGRIYYGTVYPDAKQYSHILPTFHETIKIFKQQRQRTFWNTPYENMDISSHLIDFLKKQCVQSPFPLFSGWLASGHISDFISFVPMPTWSSNPSRHPIPFKVLYASPASLYSILHNMNPYYRLWRKNERKKISIQHFLKKK